MNYKNLYSIVAVTVTLFIHSCSGNASAEAEPELKTGDFNLTVENSVNGAFSESFEATKAVLKLSDEAFGSKLLVEIKRTSSQLPINPDDSDICGKSSGKSNEWCLTADILGENDLPVQTNLDKYGYDPFEKALSLKEGETIWLEFSVGDEAELKENPDKAKKVKLISSVQKKGISADSGGEDDLDFEDIEKMQKVMDKSLEQMDKSIDQYERVNDMMNE